jgi:Zn-finger nucleic acid-binding protein
MIPVCPKCDIGLLIVNFQSIEVDYCDRCRGLWLDAGELATIMQVSSDPLERFRDRTVKTPGSGKHLCPRCDKSMDELTITGPATGSLTLDSCPAGHGLWFDADELQQLLAADAADTGAQRTIAYLNDLFGKKSTQPTN